MIDPEAITIVAIQTIFGREPEKPVVVLQDIEHHALRQSVGSRQAFEIGILCQRITADKEKWNTDDQGDN